MSSSFLASALFASAALAWPVFASGSLIAQESPAGNADAASSQDGAAPQEGAPQNAQLNLPQTIRLSLPLWCRRCRRTPQAAGLDSRSHGHQEATLPEDAETTFNQKVSREFRS